MKSAHVLGAAMLLGLGLTGCGGSAEMASGDAGYPQTGPDVAAEATAGPELAQQSPGARAKDSDREAPASKGMEPPPELRPGLGTEWGETRSSVITSSPFLRADPNSPFATASLFYNDEHGASAMATSSGFKRVSHGSVDIGGGLATLSLKDGQGKFLSGFEAGGKSFLIGEEGERYSIVIDNHVPARLEVIVSVDGLDVLDGKAASTKKRGYILEPHGSLEIDGFRQSMETVAAFRFGAVESSYASQKHGEARNVGVIGVALFHEQGSSPKSWTFSDTNLRLKADPFPGRFATPP
ncbi:MAG: hypothetical protein IPM79_14365 [Polyangiaceae bacterium]|jgi:hypothetical protein|nr:hypothetical protein [Polyangiaceae bacterium]MBK8938772.1 hypothetical protein [Polyangiaceae bacterium]